MATLRRIRDSEWRVPPSLPGVRVLGDNETRFDEFPCSPPERKEGSVSKDVRIEAFSHELNRRALLHRAGLGATAGWLATHTPTAVGTAAAQDEQRIIVVLPEEPPELDPFFYALSHIPVTRNIFEALVGRDAQTADLTPGLATEWEAINPTTWRFRLRGGVTYHNGAPFNAEAAAFGINWAFDDAKGARVSSNEGPEITATAIDELTLDVTTAEPDPILPRRLYLVGLPEPGTWQADPTEAVRSAVGTGPYRLVDYRGGERISLSTSR